MKVQQARADVQLMLGLVLSSTHLRVNIMKTQVFHGTILSLNYFPFYISA